MAKLRQMTANIYCITPCTRNKLKVPIKFETGTIPLYFNIEIVPKVLIKIPIQLKITANSKKIINFFHFFHLH